MNHATTSQRPGGLWSIGTTGWLISLYYMGRKRMLNGRGISAHGRHNMSTRTLFAIESAQSSKQMELHLSPGDPAIRLLDEDGFLLPVQSVQGLAAECLQHRNTRRYGEKLKLLPEATTDDGVGGIPLVSLVAGLSVLPQLDRMIESRILAQRDRRRIDADHEGGQSVDHSSRNVQIICGNFAGGTFPGLAILLASRIKYYSRKHGLDAEVVVLGTTPSALSGGDLLNAQGNYAMFIRQAVLAMDEPRRIVFHALNGDDITHTEPLIDRIVPFSPSTGKVTLATRDELAAQMAIAAWLMLDSPYGAKADSMFRDHMNDRLDDRYGFRGFSRLGVSLMRVDRDRCKSIAAAHGAKIAASAVLGQ